jgi:hypothetical protein
MGTCQTTPVQNMKNKYRTLVEKWDSSLIYIKKPSAAYTINLSESLIKGKYDEALRYLKTLFKPKNRS